MTTIRFAVVVLVALVAAAAGGFVFGRGNADPAVVPAGATPAVCIEALDYAARGFGYSADASEGAQAAAEALADGDVSRARDTFADIAEANDAMASIADEAGRAAAACRAGAE